MATAERTVFAGGFLPERIGPAGELRRLTANADAAQRVFERFQDHDSEIAFARASYARVRFIEANPGVGR